MRVEYTKCIVYAIAGATFGLAGVTDYGRLGAGDTLAEAVPRVYGLRLAEIESQWRRVLGG